MTNLFIRINKLILALTVPCFIQTIFSINALANQLEKKSHTVEVHLHYNDFERRVRCTGVILSKEIILTAAHCINSNFFSWSEGKEALASSIYFYTENDDKKEKINLEILEVGNFYKNKGQMEDYAVLKASSPIPESHRPAIIPSLETYKKLTMPLSKIYHQSFPATFFRTPPFKPYFSHNGKLTTTGYFVDEYKVKEMFISIKDTGYYQPLTGETNLKKLETKLSKSKKNKIDLAWKDFSKLQDLKNGYKELYDAFKFYEKYRDDKNMIHFHTADYSYGSSGGGIFSINDDYILGIIPASSTVGDPSLLRLIGHSYGIHHICRHSKTLKERSLCPLEYTTSSIR